MLADLGAACHAAHTAPAAARRRRRRSLLDARLPRARALRRDVRRGGRLGVGLLVSRYQAPAVPRPLVGREPSAPPRRAARAARRQRGRAPRRLADAVALVQALLSRDVTARRWAGERRRCARTLRRRHAGPRRPPPRAPPPTTRRWRPRAARRADVDRAGVCRRASARARRRAAQRGSSNSFEASRTNPNVLLELDADGAG